jgi:hypothetical protein
VCTGLLALNSAWAVPRLQLDAEGGLYDPVSQTIVTHGDPFTIYALMQGLDVTGQFFLSAALAPNAVGDAAFTVNSVAYSLPATSGTPLGLPTHDVFATRYVEIPFNFSPTYKANSYDAQYNPGGFELYSGSGAFLYFKEFVVDIDVLPEGSVLHFDLYNKKADGSVKKFAPFSHDVEWRVPDGGMTLALLGFGLLGLGAVSRRFNKA